MEFLSDVHGKDPHRPSIFELVFQEQLRDHLQPALKYVLSVFATRYPRYLLRIVNKHEEFYAFIMFFVERYYLRKHNASFSENFYGLKRRRKPLFDTDRAIAAVGPEAAAQESRLRRGDIRWSLLFLVGIPYLRAKAHDYWEQLGGGANVETINTRDSTSQSAPPGPQLFAERLRYWFKIVYPWADVGFELWLLSYNIAYLFDRIPFYRPWLSWMGLDIRRMGAEDYPAPPPSRSATSPPPSRPILALLKRLLRRAPSLLLESLKVLLPLSLFFVKFLEWWYSPTSPARALGQTQAGPTIPPPKMIRPHPHGVLGGGKEVKYGVCPLCEKPVANATALPSGYLFCYKCVFAEVEKSGRCPVTLLPMRTWMLRKVLV